MFKRIREMKCTDLAFAADCARATGRISETVEELENFLLCDAKGCWIAEYSRKPVGFCVARSYGRCGFLGAVVLDGIKSHPTLERELLDHAVRYLVQGGCENVFAEVREGSVSGFERAGFVKLCRILQFAGTVYGRCHKHVRELRPQELSAIVGLDRHSFRANRLYFLGRRFSLAPQFCKVLEMNGKIGGYIMARRAESIVPVGPWVISEDVDCPADLLEALAAETGGEKMVIEVLETNTGGVELLRAMGFVESQESTWRMLLGPQTNVGQADSLYAIGSPFMG
jgi:ribosomal protein S18 acetylase RimI-like enzyme